MALNANMVWEVRNGGSDTACSGGFRNGLCQLARPIAPTVNGSASGGTVAAGTYYIVVTYVDAYGETRYSPETSVTLSGATSSFTIVSPSNPGNAAAWKAFSSTTSGGPYFDLTSVTSFGTNLTRTTTPPTSGTNPVGIDRTQSNSAYITIDGVTITATVQVTTTNLKLTGTTVSADDVGNTVIITGGTATAGTYEIVGWTGTDTWILDRSAGSSTQTATGSMGGAHATIGKPAGLVVGGNFIAVKYNASAQQMSASTNVAAGSVSLSVACRIFSYDSNRSPNNSDANRQQVQPSANSVTAFTFSSGNGSILANFEFTNPTNKTTWKAANVSNTRTKIRNCKVSGTIATPFTVSGAETVLEDCYVSAASVTGNSFDLSGTPTIVNNCVVDGQSGSTAAFNIAGGFVVLLDCASINSQAGNGDIRQAGLTQAVYTKNFTIHRVGNTGNQGSIQQVYPVSRENYYENVIIWGDGTNFDLIAAPQVYSGPFPHVRIKNLASGNSGSGSTTTNVLAADQITNNKTLTAIPFTNAGTGDFSLNSSSNGGVLCKGTGNPSTLAGIATNSYPDIGAAQHLDAGTTSINIAYW